MGHHPRRADLGGNPVQRVHVIPENQQDHLGVGRLDHKEVLKPLDRPHLRSEIAFSLREQVWVNGVLEAEKIHDCGHTVNLASHADRPLSITGTLRSGGQRYKTAAKGDHALSPGWAALPKVTQL